MNGIEFLKVLEKEKKAWQKYFWIILLTSSNQPTDLELVKNFRIANILKKPLTFEKVKLVLREAFQARDSKKFC